MQKPSIEEVRAALLRCVGVRKEQFRPWSYGEFAKVWLNLPRMPEPQWWKPVLDQIAREELRHGRPDLTFMLKNKKHRYLSQIGWEPADPPTDEQRQMTHDRFQKLPPRCLRWVETT